MSDEKRNRIITWGIILLCMGTFFLGVQPTTTPDEWVGLFTLVAFVVIGLVIVAIVQSWRQTMRK